MQKDRFGRDNNAIPDVGGGPVRSLRHVRHDHVSMWQKTMPRASESWKTINVYVFSIGTFADGRVLALCNHFKKLFPCTELYQGCSPREPFPSLHSSPILLPLPQFNYPTILSTTCLLEVRAVASHREPLVNHCHAQLTGLEISP